MKKSSLALALAGAFFAMSAHAQSSVTLYGVIDTGLTYSSNQQGHSSWQETSAATENTVFGLKGSEDLGGGSHAIFKLENGFNLNNGSSFNTSDAFGEQAVIDCVSAACVGLARKSAITTSATCGMDCVRFVW
jgi:predicted porin